MSRFSIGIILDSFRLPLAESLDLAAGLGAQGIQVYATKGVMAPENMNSEQRKSFLHQVQDRGLVISALCGDLGRGFGNAALNPALIEKSKRILELAKDLETDVIVSDKRDIGTPFAVPVMKGHPVEDYRMLSYVGKLSERTTNRIAKKAQEVWGEFMDIKKAS